MPVCVCACYLRQLRSQLRAGSPWHQCGWREARYWRRVQRVLNPGLLEGSLSFSHFSLSLSRLSLSLCLYLSLSLFLIFSLLTKCMQRFLWESASVWKLCEIYVVSNRSSPCLIFRLSFKNVKSISAHLILRRGKDNLFICIKFYCLSTTRTLFANVKYLAVNTC